MTDRTPRALTVQTAAALFGVSESAILKRIGRGKLAADKDQAGHWRVYLPDTPDGSGPDIPQDRTGHQTDPGQPLSGDVAALRARIGGLQALLDQVAGERDTLREQVQQLTRLLDQQQQLTLASTRALPSPAQAARRSWWPWTRPREEK